MIYASPGQAWWHWWSQAPLHHFSSSPRQCLCWVMLPIQDTQPGKGRYFHSHPPPFFSFVTFLLPKKLHVPSGQVIKLEDQQYMKKEQDQFTEKWLKAVYYIFYLFFFLFFFPDRSFTKSLKERIKWMGWPATKSCLFLNKFIWLQYYFEESNFWKMKENLDEVAFEVRF